MDWSKIGSRLDEVERAVALASQMDDDEIGWGLRALLMAALSEVLPDEDAEDEGEDVSDDLVAIVAHMESRCRYAERMRVREVVARREARRQHQRELREVQARGVAALEAVGWTVVPSLAAVEAAQAMVAPVVLSGVPRLAVVSSDGVDPATRTARVLAHLEGCGEPQKTSQVAEALGFAEKPTGNALYRLQRAGQVAKVDGLWCLPAAAVEDADTLEADCEAVLCVLDKAGEAQPFEVLVERSGLGSARTSAAVNDLVRRGVLVASAGSYARAPRGKWKRGKRRNEDPWEVALTAILQFAHTADEVVERRMNFERDWGGVYLTVDEFDQAMHELARDGLLVQAGEIDGVPYFVAPGQEASK